MTPRLNRSQLANADAWWKRDKGTHEIAKLLGVPEAAVANSLSDLREKRRAARSLIEERGTRDDAVASREAGA